MDNENGRNSARQAQLHASRVRLFQVLCALDGVGEITEPEIESKFSEMYVASPVDEKKKGKEESEQTSILEAAEVSEEPDEEEDIEEISAKEFRATCRTVFDLRSHIKEIDALINEYSLSWRLDRMNLVDRNAIRLAVYESLIKKKKVPIAVAISEAVIIAHEFGSVESPRFVNGVLAKIVHAPER